MDQAGLSMRPIMQQLRADLRQRQAGIVQLLGRFVRCESPSHDKSSVDRMARIVAKQWRRRGAKVTILAQKARGDHVRSEVWLGRGRPTGQILVLGHLDTVYPLGTLAKTPFRISAGCAWGPGTFDMKAGLVLALAAVDALKSLGLRPEKRLVFLWNSDEEIDSESSRYLIEREARRSDAVLVLEPALGPGGDLKTARKGVGTAEIIVLGRSAHAGLNPQAGVNAVHELALQTVRLMKMNDPRRGVTVQVTVMAGGTVPNVVPDVARAKIDLRVTRRADAPLLERALHGLRPILPGARIEMRGGINRPPLERAAGVVDLFRRAQSLMQEIGVPLGESFAGGGSDGNFTAALGIPTLDGLGAVGDGAHSPREHVVIGSLPDRATLLAGLLQTL
ncbi:MAG TPA: M20 family metallopeptidase [Candidatus Acidoferrales bacterium]|nr:M20 family metallopeptidase [Candidatus Acidoferrales bacterium]